VYLWGEYRQPSQVYELIGALAVLGIVWRARTHGAVAGSGFNFLLVVALSAAARVLLEAFRGDSLLVAGGWRAAQLLGLAVLAACLAAMRYWVRAPAPPVSADTRASAPSDEINAKFQ
jgi:prolipoprotein diacylglyceryltransferase